VSASILATARWAILHGDPAAVDHGRWIAESPGIGYVDVFEAAPDDTARVATLLRARLESDGHEVGKVTISYGDPWAPAGGATVTAYEPDDETTSGAGTPEDTAVDVGEDVDGTGAGGTEVARPHPLEPTMEELQRAASSALTFPSSSIFSIRSFCSFMQSSIDAYDLVTVSVVTRGAEVDPRCCEY